MHINPNATLSTEFHFGIGEISLTSEAGGVETTNEFKTRYQEVICQGGALPPPLVGLGSLCELLVWPPQTPLPSPHTCDNDGCDTRNNILFSVSQA